MRVMNLTCSRNDYGHSFNHIAIVRDMILIMPNNPVYYRRFDRNQTLLFTSDTTVLSRVIRAALQNVMWDGISVLVKIED